MKHQSPSFSSLLQGSDFTLLWHVIGPFTIQAPLSYRHRTRDRENSWLVTFFNRPCSSVSCCQGVVFVHLFTVLPQEFRSLMIVWRAGKTHKKFKHYSCGQCSAAMWHPGMCDSYYSKTFMQLIGLLSVPQEQFQEQCFLKQRWLMEAINKLIKNKTVTQPVSGKCVNQLNCCVKHLHNET